MVVDGLGMRAVDELGVDELGVRVVDRLFMKRTRKRKTVVSPRPGLLPVRKAAVPGFLHSLQTRYLAIRHITRNRNRNRNRKQGLIVVVIPPAPSWRTY